jgi:argininosuccinate lyase
MPSSFGLWFGAYAESLTDDMVMMKAAFDITNRNPLGSAAGYGSSFPIDRQITTDLLGFASMNFNSVYAQITRGKTEKVIGNALASVASTISKMAMDICLFNSQNFGFISLPVEYTTGSSIMPHKKNPDVMELLRAKCNKIQAVSYEISLITGNLPSGYHRDMQILKEILFPAFKTLKQCLEILTSMMDKINVNASILDDTKYNLIFTVEEVNKLVLNGMAFRDAYKEVSAIVEKGNYKTDKKVNHTHQGSIGNLCNDKISELMDKIVDSFPFQTIEMAIHQLMITSVYKEEENR